jgi:acyl-coenzyme A synthetase/AMP-(fatty) acid ligase
MVFSRRTLNPLWQEWGKTVRYCRDKVILIDAVSQATWTGRDLSLLVEKFLDEISVRYVGERIGFRLAGAQGIALFLALQRKSLVAVPFDGGMPKEGCWNLAGNLQISALYWDGVFHSFDSNPQKGQKWSCLKITSGITEGIPKVIECRAEHLLADGQQIIKSMSLRRKDRHLAVIPLGHSYGLGNLIVPLILQGTTLIYAEQFVPRQLIEWMDRFQVTVFPGVPALFRALAAMPGNKVPSFLRLAISAGAPLQAEVARAFFHRYQTKIHNFYGSSETGGICYDRTGSASLRGRSVGKPLVEVAVSIRRGKIVVKSAAVATRSGQWELPDKGEWNQRGELVLLGRMGHNANIGGKKVHPFEIEKVLRGMAAVSDAGVWILQSGGREYLGVAVETTLNQQEIERHLAAYLPAWKMPKCYFIAPELPRTFRGKLDASILRKHLGILSHA